MEKNGWTMSVATRGVRGEVGTPTTLWSPPGMLSHMTGRRDTTARHTNIATLTADWPRLTAPGRKRGEGRSSLCVRHGVSVSGCQQPFSSSSPRTLLIRTRSHTQTSVTLPDTGHCTLALKIAAVALDILNAVCSCHCWWVELKGL